MKTIRRCLCVLVLGLLCVMLRSEGVHAEAVAERARDGAYSIYYETVVGEGDTLCLVISGSGEMRDYENIDCDEDLAPWVTDSRAKLAYYAEVTGAVTRIGNCAFTEMRYVYSVTFSDSVVSIGERVFSKCSTLREVHIPNSVTSIDKDAFVGVESRVVIYCEKGSYAYNYAIAKGLRVSLENCAHSDAEWVVKQEATCGKSGEKQLVCQDCGEVLEKATISATGDHTWGEWSDYQYKIVGNKTVVTEKVRYCIVCRQKETTPVSYAVESITISSSAKTLKTGKTLALTATVAPSYAADTSVSWSSSNTKYATVSTDGVVKANAAGAGHTVTITATAKDGSGVKATYKIKIKAVSVKTITISGKSSVKAGKKITLIASVLPVSATNTSMSWSSSNTKYATVSADGVVKANAAGAGHTVTITATAKDGSGVKATFKIKIKSA